MLGLLEVEGLENMRALRNNFQIREYVLCMYFTHRNSKKRPRRVPARLLRSSQF
ncbi:uncharacterized protein B0T23DRAFT_385524 [Neurospora hispaniola]|uniref:Uncharacterized protein n=1 Tax=Neurospora hispaniola TaxID=588809 RepID=A0AAJ0I4E6_9PEZI|nr:hypothetical protein B0T23DRAFT_385524 [Neurospora hispaniola]